eukprot:1172492-Prorocentrum_minimum.AAC.1
MYRSPTPNPPSPPSPPSPPPPPRVARHTCDKPTLSEFTNPDTWRDYVRMARSCPRQVTRPLLSANTEGRFGGRSGTRGPVDNSCQSNIHAPRGSCRAPGARTCRA